MNKRFVSIAVCYLLIMVLSGCATVKEMGKGFIGVSTQVLEEKRKDALKKTFALGYNDCYVKVKDILNMKDKESSIYAEDLEKKMIAIYFSSTDTTPVGIFFTEESKVSTLIEVSSPSMYAKEEIASRIFSGLSPASPNQKENKADVKEETGN
ncbi:MAG: hypothetical protein KKC39_02100 [Candidatus Omnitrophica bacterium]|nr:hypothetical protein [Candidatus Omnitrophota bacterium]MBU4467524.1 hypothetical protein [Candidatus Omnitrophota bacterium]MCG2713284.1 hypothetical protein [Candidatus Omnitrophota bacterium]